VKNADQLIVRDLSDGVELTVKVVPGASRGRLVGVLGDCLKITTSAPAEKGKANAAAAKILAKVLALDPRHVTLTAGQKSHRKKFRIDGISAARIRELLKDHTG